MAYRALGAARKRPTRTSASGAAAIPSSTIRCCRPTRMLESAVRMKVAACRRFEDRQISPARSPAFRKGLELAPDDASLRYWLGAALYASGDAAGAEREFRKWSRRDPGLREGAFQPGRHLRCQGQRREGDRANTRQRSTPIPTCLTPACGWLTICERQVRWRPQLSSTTRRSNSIHDGRRMDRRCAGADRAEDGLDQASEWLTRARPVHSPDRPELGAIARRRGSERLRQGVRYLRSSTPSITSPS